ncbi:MAG: dethiobiotin synthase [Solirubrobacterales bacterium]
MSDLPRGIFVTGTDTGAGKSVAAAAVCASLAVRGERVAAFKPAVTGLDEPADGWPPDHELLASVAGAGQSPNEVAPYRFGPPASPHLAAELAGARIEPRKLLDAARVAAEEADALVVEGVGGLMVPLTPGYLVRDLAIDLALPVVVAARAGLGTINHALLTIDAARSGGLRVAGVVMTPWPAEPSALERSNRETVERLGGVPVTGLRPTDPESLAEAGSELPLDEWLAGAGAET